MANSPDVWFVYLRAAGISTVRLSRAPQNNPKISDRMSAAFVGDAGTWAMEAVQQNGRRVIWLSRWEVWNQNAPERRIWRVSYGRVSEMRSSTAPGTDLESLAARVRSALAAIHAFSEQHECGGFTARFSEAMETLDSGGAKRYGYHKDLAFQGEVQVEYDRTSERLFLTLTEAIQAVANASCR